MTDDDAVRRIVRDGYEAVAGRYLAVRRHDTADVTRVEHTTADLPEGARVLDAGCGSGIPIAAALARRFRVIGIDLSPAQIGLAREHVPTATFEVADMAAFELPDASLDAIVCLYALFHLPRIEHAAVLARFARFLRSDGRLLVSFGVHDEALGTDGSWLDSGVPMVWSSFDPDTDLALVTDAGFAIRASEIVTEARDFGRARHLIVEAAKR